MKPYILRICKFLLVSFVSCGKEDHYRHLDCSWCAPQALLRADNLNSVSESSPDAQHGIVIEWSRVFGNMYSDGSGFLSPERIFLSGLRARTVYRQILPTALVAVLKVRTLLIRLFDVEEEERYQRTCKSPWKSATLLPRPWINHLRHSLHQSPLLSPVIEC